MTAAGSPDPHGLANLVDDLEKRIAAERQPDASDRPDPHNTEPSGVPAGEADLDLTDLNDLTGAGATQEPAEPPA